MQYSVFLVLSEKNMISAIHRYLHSLKIRQLTVSLIIRTFRHPSINTFYADTAIKTANKRTYLTAP
nr:MAG TPA: hypothetical protein [Caudoviricetes sp.]